MIAPSATTIPRSASIRNMSKPTTIAVTPLLPRAIFESAIADYDEAIRLDPKFAKSYYNRGVAREKKSNLVEALSDFEAYAQLVPSDPDGPKSVARVKTELSAMSGRR